jgi:FAM210A/B-like domain
MHASVRFRSTLATPPPLFVNSTSRLASSNSSTEPRSAANLNANHTGSTSSNNRLPPPQVDEEDEDLEVVVRKHGKVRGFLRKYGPLGAVTYFSIYGMTLTSLYFAVDNGLLGSGDVIAMLRDYDLEWFLVLLDVDLDNLNPKAGSFALAWIITKLTEPLRFATTLAVTPLLVRRRTKRVAAAATASEADAQVEEESVAREQQQSPRPK